MNPRALKRISPVSLSANSKPDNNRYVMTVTGKYRSFGANEGIKVFLSTGSCQLMGVKGDFFSADDVSGM